VNECCDTIFHFNFMPVQNLATIQQISKNGTLGITWVNKLGMRACVTEVYT